MSFVNTAPALSIPSQENLIFESHISIPSGGALRAATPPYARMEELLESVLKVQQRYLDAKNPNFRSDSPIGKYFSPSSDFKTYRADVILKDTQPVHDIEEEVEIETKPALQQGKGNSKAIASTRPEKYIVQKDPQALQNLRLEAAQKFERPEPPPDILAMNALQRNEYWNQQKAKNIEKKRAQLADKDLDNCTFAPQLYSRIQTNTPLTCRGKQTFSYAGLSKAKKDSPNSKTKPKHRGAIETKEEPIAYMPAYKGPLSPHPMQVRYKAGFNLNMVKKNAK